MRIDKSPIKCHEAVSELQDLLEKQNFNQIDLTGLCQKFPDCKKELHTLFELWKELDDLEVPEPSNRMQANFQLLLHSMNEENKPLPSMPKNNKKRHIRPIYRWSGIAAAFLVGLIFGTVLLPYWNNHKGTAVEEVAEFQMLPYQKLVKSTTAIDRLQALQMTKAMDQIDGQIIDILNDILLHDDNVNVRLSALDAMVSFADHPKVKENLIRAIPFQTSSIIQLTLAELAIALEDKRAIGEIKELLRKGQVELEVRLKLEDTLEILM